LGNHCLGVKAASLIKESARRGIDETLGAAEMLAIKE
jgi:hypothetical protein